MAKATAKEKPRPPPPQRRAVPRELKLGGATLRLTDDGRLKVSGVRIPDPEQNAFIPEKRDGSIWVEALLAWCQRYEALSPRSRTAYGALQPDDVGSAGQKLQGWLSEMADPEARIMKPVSPRGLSGAPPTSLSPTGSVASRASNCKMVVWARRGALHRSAQTHQR